jgi:hypothetical protein
VAIGGEVAVGEVEGCAAAAAMPVKQSDVANAIEERLGMGYSLGVRKRECVWSQR